MQIWVEKLLMLGETFRSKENVDVMGSIFVR